tara:strand:- start:1271 stop:1375 length:105 start_codon:yes stop_codon:yes gene_type:complete
MDEVHSFRSRELTADTSIYIYIGGKNEIDSEEKG